MSLSPRILRVGASRWSTWLAWSWRSDPVLTLISLLLLIVLAGTLIGVVVDPRVIGGAPAWLKPAKFAISLAIFGWTFIWLLRFVTGHPRLVRLASTITALVSIIEMTIIAIQAARGTTSHYNMTTQLDAVLFQTMGSAIVVLWLMVIMVALLLLRQRLEPPALAWSLRLGVTIALVGMALAFLMTSPTPDQIAAARTGQGLPIVGAHAVGVADGGPGLPIVGWSTNGGDLRIAHFVGLHAMQVLPFVGWWLSRRRLPAGHQIRLIVTWGLAYLGLVILLAWQALRAQALLAPDGLTVALLVSLVLGAGVVSAMVTYHGRQLSRQLYPDSVGHIH